MARAVKIIDGDTFDVLDSNMHVIRIRMNGIDAPEKKQPFGNKAKQTLTMLIIGQPVRIVPHEKDRNGRWIADSYLGHSSLSAAMVREGMAWHFKKYSSDSTLAQLELEARRQKKGLWSDPNPIAPWEYRNQKRSARTANPANSANCELRTKISFHNFIYLVPNSRHGSFYC